MERIEEVKALQEKEDEIRNEPRKFRIESDVEVLEEDEIEEYRTLSDDQKREKYNEQQCETADKYIKIVDETNAKLEELTKQINDKVVEAYEAIDKEIKECESEIDENNKQIELLKEEIESIKSQIALKEQELIQLESNENYDKAEYERIAKEIEQLNEDLRLRTDMQQAKINSNNRAKEKLNKLQQEKEQLIEDYRDKVTSHLETKITKVQEKWQAKKEEVQEKMKKLEALKAAQLYKDGDENTLKEAKELNAEILYGVLAKDELADEILKLRMTINELEGREVAKGKYEGLAKRVKAAQVAQKDKTSEKINESEQQDAVQSVPSEEKPQQPDKKDIKDTKVTKTKGKSGPLYSGVTSSDTPNIDSEPKNEQVEKESEKSNEEFNELYGKIRKGTLTSKDFENLAEIMKDPASYDKFRISTGPIFNKSKLILKAMAKMVGDTNTLSKEARIKLGLAVEQANEDNGLMSRHELMEWKGLKELVANPDKKIAAEEQFKKVVAMDRETLTKEQQEVWDKAQAHLNKYSALRGALAAYSVVSKQRSQKRNSWFRGTNSKKVQELAPASSLSATASHSGIDLSNQVNSVIDESSIPPKASSIDAPAQTK